MGLPEAAIAGHFVAGLSNVPPTHNSIEKLHQLVQDDEKWDLAPLMRGLHDHLLIQGSSDDYYAILIEFAKLPRSMWREVKERVELCVEKVRKNEFARPYRVTFPETGCGFVFIPTPSEVVRDDWERVRLAAVRNFTELHKYEQRLSKCIGVLVAKNEESYEIIWCLIAHEWSENVEIQRALDKGSPFRSVSVAEVHGYLFVQDNDVA
jgi:hypothetical protein